MNSRIALRGPLFLGVTSLAIGTAWLATQFVGLHLPIVTENGPLAVVYVYLVSPGLAWIFARQSAEPKRYYGVLWLQTLCLLSPLVVVPAWTTTAGPLPGVGLANFGFFVGWLTRYPNLGPINYEVLLGIVCVLGTAILPALFGLCARLSERLVRDFVAHSFYFSCSCTSRSSYAWTPGSCCTAGLSQQECQQASRPSGTDPPRRVCLSD